MTAYLRYGSAALSTRSSPVRLLRFRWAETARAARTPKQPLDRLLARLTNELTNEG